MQKSNFILYFLAIAWLLPSSSYAAENECLYNGKKYTIGAVIKKAEDHYQCVLVHVNELNSKSILAWVKLESDMKSVKITD
jgi:hypothetical protein